MPDSAANRLDHYAHLIVRVGVNLQPGQELLVQCDLEQAPLARALTEAAYRSGAAYVDVLYADSGVRRALVEHGPDAALSFSPSWMLERLRRIAELRGCAVLIGSGSNAELFAGLDEGRLARARPIEYQRAWIRAVMGREIAWSIVAYPTERWASEIFGSPEVERLWEAASHVLRLDDPDPVEAWNRRFEQLESRAAQLTERRFDALRYRGPGTDLEVGLIAGARWLAGRSRTLDGHLHGANLPTEEVFTSPHRLRAEGTIRSSLPLALGGTKVDGLELRLAGGEIVEVHARSGQDAARADIATDDGARRLGELALVDDSSRVAETGIVFNNMLFDENAVSHVAWGKGIDPVLAGVVHGELVARGLNESATHIDFMVGCPELEIDGIEVGGHAVPLLLGGRWQLA